jgi:hypothetical protein
MKIYSAIEALDNLRTGRMSFWCGDSEEQPGANESYAARRLGEDVPDLRVTKRFDIAEGSSIFAMGSCFAREIELALAKANFKILSFDDAVMGSDLFQGRNGDGAGSFLFRYTTASMKMEISRVLGAIDVPDDKLLVGEPESLLDLNFGGLCVRGNLDLIAARRRAIKDVGQGLKVADVVVLTLGLTEAWFDTEAGLYINAAPDLPLLRRSKRFEMHSLTFQENYQNVKDCIALIRAHNPNAKFVITVSPIPLQATFTGKDIVVANMRSKSTLRAVAAAIEEEDDSVLYFPSYEMVMYSKRDFAWKGDMRHVRRPMVEKIIALFKRTHDIDDGSQTRTVAVSELPIDPTLEVIRNGQIQVQADEILVHPLDAATGVRSAFDIEGIDATALKEFRATVLVTHPEAKPVRFGADLSIAGSASTVCSADVTAAYGKSETLGLSIPADIGDKTLTLRLWTEMADPESSTAYAWAKFLSSQLVYGR